MKTDLERAQALFRHHGVGPNAADIAAELEKVRSESQALGLAMERERCATICDDVARLNRSLREMPATVAAIAAAMSCAEAIRKGIA